MKQNNGLTSGLVIILIIGIICLSGCTSNASYTLGNSTFQMPNAFVKENVTSIDDPDYGYLSEMTFKLNGEYVLGVDQYVNAAEYQKGLADDIFTGFETSTKNIGGTQVTILEDPSTHEKNYFFTKNGKYYSVVTAFSLNNDKDLNQIESAMNMVVETMN